MQLGRDFVRIVTQLTKERGLPPELIRSSFEAALISAYKKYRGGEQEAEIIVDIENGSISVFETRKIVKLVAHPDLEMTAADAVNAGVPAKPKPKLGEIVKIPKNPEDFGRIAAQTARQVIIQRLKDAERQIVFEEFANRIGEMVSGVIVKSENDHVVVRLSERSEGILPREERISREKYIVGERMKFFLLDVRQTTKGPRIIVSRTHPGLLRKILELEVPEIKDGIIEIKNIVREDEGRAKVAVYSLDPNVDPVGACVGNQGARIKGISKELMGEKIDVIVWSNDPFVYIKNALSPAKISKIDPALDQDKAVLVLVHPDQLSLAIGKSGQNVRLAARLTGWKIDISAVEIDRMPTLYDIFHDINITEDGAK
ncbi:MAG: transcription termination factor NusA [Synergistaceae bacterium]|nr:transcription termination factor NusA [Synergistaceae bacterium]